MTRMIADIAGSADPPPGKIARDRLVRLRVDAVSGADILPTLLAIVRGYALVPVDVASETFSRSQVVELLLDRRCFRPSPCLLDQLEALPGVRGAEFFNFDNQPLKRPDRDIVQAA